MNYDETAVKILEALYKRNASLVIQGASQSRPISAAQAANDYNVILASITPDPNKDLG